MGEGTQEKREGGGGAGHAASRSTLGKAGGGGEYESSTYGVLLEMRELAEGFLTEVTTVGLG